MRLFGNDDAIAMALAVGELKAEVAALRRDVERLTAPPVVPEAAAPLISPKVAALIQQMGQGHGELVRHLEQEARGMAAQNIDEANILFAIRNGS